MVSTALLWVPRGVSAHYGDSMAHLRNGDSPLPGAAVVIVDDDTRRPRQPADRSVRWSRGPVVGVVLGLAAAFALGLFVGRVGLETRVAGSPVPVTITAPQTPTSATGAQTSVPAATANDSLIPGQGFGFNTGEGRITVVIDVQSITDAPLTLAGPVQLVGLDGRPMAGSSGRLVPGWDYGLSTDPPAALSQVAPRQQIEIVVSADLDCHTPTAKQNWSENAPVIVIPFEGFANPWRKTLNDLLSSSRRYGLYATVCPDESGGPSTEAVSTEPTR